jgi:hypothetical protein
MQQPGISDNRNVPLLFTLIPDLPTTPWSKKSPSPRYTLVLPAFLPARLHACLPACLRSGAAHRSLLLIALLYSRLGLVQDGAVRTRRLLCVCH